MKTPRKTYPFDEELTAFLEANDIDAVGHMRTLSRLCAKRMVAGIEKHGDFLSKSVTPIYWVSSMVEEVADAKNYLDMYVISTNSRVNGARLSEFEETAVRIMQRYLTAAGCLAYSLLGQREGSSSKR